MSDRVRFGLLAVVFSAVLFGALRWAALSQPGLWWLGYSTATVAVMLAAQGMSWGRRLAFAGATAVTSVVACELVVNSVLGGAADALIGAGSQGPSDLQLAYFVLVQLLFIALPLAALALFVGRRPSRLWSKG